MCGSLARAAAGDTAGEGEGGEGEERTRINIRTCTGPCDPHPASSTPPVCSTAATPPTTTPIIKTKPQPDVCPHQLRLDYNNNKKKKIHNAKATEYANSSKPCVLEGLSTLGRHNEATVSYKYYRTRAGRVAVAYRTVLRSVTRVPKHLSVN